MTGWRCGGLVLLGLLFWVAAGHAAPAFGREGAPPTADACAPSYLTLEPDAEFERTYQFLVTTTPGPWVRQWVFGSLARCRETQAIVAEVLARLDGVTVGACR